MQQRMIAHVSFNNKKKTHAEFKQLRDPETKTAVSSEPLATAAKNTSRRACVCVCVSCSYVHLYTSYLTSRVDRPPPQKMLILYHFNMNIKARQHKTTSHHNVNLGLIPPSQLLSGSQLSTGGHHWLEWSFRSTQGVKTPFCLGLGSPRHRDGLIKAALLTVGAAASLRQARYFLERVGLEVHGTAIKRSHGNS